MFPAPQPEMLRLSEHCAQFRIPVLDDLVKISWTHIKIKQQCSECVWVAHESTRRSERYPLIRQARMRRKLPSGATLDLCGGHGALWKDRDQEDLDNA